MYYFASDIHLGAGDPETARRTERRFVAWLDAAGRDAEAIFLLGDIFDFWFEYRRVVPKGFVRTLGKLAELTDRGVRVVFFTGNHDMWVGDYLARECGVEIHTAPQEVTLAGQRLFLAHGDNMRIEGQPARRRCTGRPRPQAGSRRACGGAPAAWPPRADRRPRRASGGKTDLPAS